jgi:L-threonylcarbamoyladenylate synthase
MDMNTQVLKPNAENLALARELLADGQVVALPTETVYGLAGDAGQAAAVERIFAAKGRPADNPLILHVGGLAALCRLAEDVPDVAFDLAGRFWPGPLTLVLKARTTTPKFALGGLTTVALRMPCHAVPLSLISENMVFAMPSANISGYPSPTTAAHVYRDLNGKIPLILDGGHCGVGYESTVIAFEAENSITMRILRPGAVTAEMLAAFGRVTVDPAVLKPLSAGQAAQSPGMKYRHYAPKAAVTAFAGSAEDFRAFAAGEADMVAIENPGYDLYDRLRQADEDGRAKIAVLLPEPKGEGLALCNRILRAAGFRVTRAGEETER